MPFSPFLSWPRFPHEGANFYRQHLIKLAPTANLCALDLASLIEGGVAWLSPHDGGSRCEERTKNDARCLCHVRDSFRLAFGEPPSSVSDDRCQESGISENRVNIKRNYQITDFRQQSRCISQSDL
jgi:hypothetical protein